MTTQEIAQRLAELIKAGDYETAHRELYHENAMSVENPVSPNDMMKYREDVGLEALAEKGKQWSESIEEKFGTGCGEPIVTENAIAMTIWFDAKHKGQERMKMEELGVYSVKDGKIIREEFIY